MRALDEAELLIFGDIAANRSWRGCRTDEDGGGEIISQDRSPVDLISSISNNNGKSRHAPHSFVDMGLADQMSRFEANLWKNLHVVAVCVLSTGGIPDPRVCRVVEKIPGRIVEVVNRPQVFEVWKLAFRKVWTEKVLNAGRASADHSR